MIEQIDRKYIHYNSRDDNDERETLFEAMLDKLDEIIEVVNQEK